MSNKNGKKDRTSRERKRKLTRRKHNHKFQKLPDIKVTSSPSVLSNEVEKENIATRLRQSASDAEPGLSNFEIVVYKTSTSSQPFQVSSKTIE